MPRSASGTVLSKSFDLKLQELRINLDDSNWIVSKKNLKSVLPKVVIC